MKITIQYSKGLKLHPRELEYYVLNGDNTTRIMQMNLARKK
jgi:hypothetical protein